MTSKPNVLMYLLLSDDDSTIDKLLEHQDAAIENTIIIATDYDFLIREEVAGQNILTPMDILAPEDIGNIFRDYYDWQEQFPSRVLSSGQTIHDASSPEGFSPATESWLLGFGNHAQLRMRFISMIKNALEKFQPSTVCVVGASANQPWSVDLLEKIIAGRFPQIQLIPPVAIMKGDQQWEIWAANNRRFQAEKSEFRITERDEVRQLTAFVQKHLPLLNSENRDEVHPRNLYNAKVLSAFLMDEDVRHLLLEEVDRERKEFMLRRQISSLRDRILNLRDRILKMRESVEIYRATIERQTKAVAQLKMVIERLKKAIERLKKPVEPLWYKARQLVINIVRRPVRSTRRIYNLVRRIVILIGDPTRLIRKIAELINSFTGK